MRSIPASWAIPLAILAAIAGITPKPDATRGVAYFEPPRSVGTPLEDLARTYRGQALADRIAGRFRLESDASLSELARRLIRRRLLQGI